MPFQRGKEEEAMLNPIFKMTGILVLSVLATIALFFVFRYLYAKKRLPIRHFLIQISTIVNKPRRRVNESGKEPWILVI